MRVFPAKFGQRVAARAGTAGRGFGVVADEVRRLGESVKESVSRVDTVIKEATEAMKEIIQFVNESAQISNSQAQTLNDLLPAIHDLRNLADQLVQMGKQEA